MYYLIIALIGGMAIFAVNEVVSGYDKATKNKLGAIGFGIGLAIAIGNTPMFNWLNCTEYKSAMVVLSAIACTALALMGHSLGVFFAGKLKH